MSREQTFQHILFEQHYGHGCRRPAYFVLIVFDGIRQSTKWLVLNCWRNVCGSQNRCIEKRRASINTMIAQPN